MKLGRQERRLEVVHLQSNSVEILVLGRAQMSKSLCSLVSSLICLIILRLNASVPMGEIGRRILTGSLAS